MSIKQKTIDGFTFAELKEAIKTALEEKKYDLVAKHVEQVALYTANGFLNIDVLSDPHSKQKKVSELIETALSATHLLVKNTSYFPRAMTVFKVFATFAQKNEDKVVGARGLLKNLDRLTVGEGSHDIFLFAAKALTNTDFEEIAQTKLFEISEKIHNSKARQTFLSRAKESLFPESEIYKAVEKELEKQKKATKLGFFQRVGRVLTKNISYRKYYNAAEKAHKNGDEESLVNAVQDMTAYIKEGHLRYLNDDKGLIFAMRAVHVADKFAEGPLYTSQAVELFMAVCEKDATKVRELNDCIGFAAEKILKYAPLLKQEEAERAFFCAANALFDRGGLERKMSKTFIKTVKKREDKNERLSILLKARREASLGSLFERKLDSEISEMRNYDPQVAYVDLPNRVNFLPMPRKSSCCALK